MIDQLPSLAQLLKVLQQVPYLASKNLYRVASHFLSSDEQKVQAFCQAVVNAKQKIEYCSVCFAWKEKSAPCILCHSPKRDTSIVCVVQSWQELFSIEKTGGYQGVYHVLCGLICPLEGIGPEDLTIDALVKRIAQGTVKEVIFAFNQTPEGEATAAYMAKKLKPYPVTLSTLARGMPVGSSLEYMDRLTVYKALSERRPF